MGLSQQIAYSSLLALFPALAGVLGFLAVFGLFDNVLRVLSNVAPHGVVEFVRTVGGDSHGRAGPAALVVGLLVAIWAASGAMRSMIKAVNRAYDRQETRPYWKVRGIAVLLVVCTGTAIALDLVLIVLGGYLGKLIGRQPGVGPIFDVLWGVLRWPVAFAVVLLFFALVYYFAPNRAERSWKWISPGSLVASLSWLGLSALFQLYVTYVGHYSRTYGTLATGVVLLLWLNYSAYALLFGAELNSELDRRADIRAAGGPHAGLVMPARRMRSR